MECERNSRENERERRRVDEICKGTRGIESAKEEKCPR